MRLKLRVQRHLVVAHMADDPGDWVFTLCRSGMSQAIGRRLVPGEEIEIEIEASEVESDEDRYWLHHWLYPQAGERKMANWQLNYGINFKGGGSPEIKCNTTTKGGNGVQIVVGGDIPDSVEFSPEDAGDLAVSVAEMANLDGLPAKEPESHVKCLDAVIEFCTKLKGKLQS